MEEPPVSENDLGDQILGGGTTERRNTMNKSLRGGA